MVGPELESSVDWIVDDLVNLLAHADIDSILQDFGTRTRTEDPVVHFYETFLAAYDPKMREARGVYYTPEPVVSYIVRSVDHILKKDFGLRDGLADTSKVRVIDPEQRTQKDRKTKDVHKVQILDPATGTATFLHAVIDQIHSTIVGQTGGNKGMWSGYVKNHLLPRLHGFELLMAPYTVAHMKLGLQLAELGYDFDSDERLKIYLTNALEEAHQFPSLPLFGQAIARESQEAGQVKQDAPVMVVLGNPPYSGVSANMSKETAAMVEPYKYVDGQHFGERKHWLQDDYVKFLRFAQTRIEKTGYGVLAFVTNHGYLDNPTFRGMRQSLLETFDRLYLLDLHGNAKKGEVSPDGTPDKNVFDIQQGVAIGIFVKDSNSKNKTVFHADLWGVREDLSGTREVIGGKYPWLGTNDVSTTNWKAIEPSSPYYFFKPHDESSKSDYEQGWKITDVMSLNSSGIVTARDHFVIDFDADKLLSRVADLRAEALSDEALRGKYFQGKGSSKYLPGDSRGWKLPDARRQIRRDEEWQERVQPILYRPFDIRKIYHVPWMVDWHRQTVMKHMLSGKNYGMVVCRQLLQ